MKWALGAAGGIVVLFIIFAIIGHDSRPVTEKIAENCKREFGAQGQNAVLNCEIALTAKVIQERKGAQFDRAASGIH